MLAFFVKCYDKLSLIMQEDTTLIYQANVFIHIVYVL